MKTKTITINQVMFSATALLRSWEDEKGNIKIKGKALFNLIALKKEFEKLLQTAQEGVQVIAEQNGGILKQEIGGYEIPEEHREAAARAMDEYARGEVTVNYSTIIMGPDDDIPIAILEAIFDYVEMG